MSTAKKPAAKKAPAKKAALKLSRGSPKLHLGGFAPAPRSKPKPRISAREDLDYVQSDLGLYLPRAVAKPVVVPPNKLRQGIEAAQAQIKKTLQGLASTFTQDFEVSEIELTLGFSADGKFLGFGPGGEMSITIKIAPAGDV